MLLMIQKNWISHALLMRTWNSTTIPEKFFLLVYYKANKQKMQLPYNPAIALLDIILEKLHVHTKVVHKCLYQFYS